MKNMDFGKYRFAFICLAILLAVLGVVFRNNYEIFIGFSYLCLGFASICLYFSECKKKDSSSGLYIIGGILFIILSVLFWFF